MIRRIFSTAALVVFMMALSASSYAETLDHGDSGEPTSTESESGSPDGPGSLPFEAVNWLDFQYQGDEAVQAASAHGVHQPGPPMVAVIVNFLILLALLYFIGRKPLTEYLKARSDSVREGLAQAKELLEEANERLADYSSRLERMDDEMTKLREEFIAAGEAERDRLVADATLKADRLRRDAETRLEQEFSQLRDEPPGQQRPQLPVYGDEPHGARLG